MKQSARWAIGVFAGTSLALLVAGVVGAFGSGDSASSKKLVSAKATISGPGVTGTITFTQSASGPLSPVQVVAVVQGLSNGKHGLHVHAGTTCGASPFTTAGGHFDPGPSGSSTPVETNHPFHSGDLPNLVSQGGLAILVYLHGNRFTLDNGPSGLFLGGNRAVVVHGSEDKYLASSTATNAGGTRVACGVIQPG